MESNGQPKWVKFEAPARKGARDPVPKVKVGKNGSQTLTAIFNKAAQLAMKLQKGARCDLYLEDGGTRIGIAPHDRGAYRLSVSAAKTASVELYHAIALVMGKQPENGDAFPLILPKIVREGDKPVYAIDVKPKAGRA